MSGCYAQVAIAEQGATSPITISLPENVELRILVAYVSQQFKLNIRYDQSLGTQARRKASAAAAFVELTASMAG